MKDKEELQDINHLVGTQITSQTCKGNTVVIFLQDKINPSAVCKEYVIVACAYSINLT